MSLARRATIISTITALLLFSMKVVVGFFSGSVAVLASAIDSVLDILASLFNYFAIKTSEEPPNENFNYGKGKIEALATLVEGVIIVISGFYIFYESINKLLYQNKTQFLNITLAVMVVSIFITLFLVLYLKKVAKQTDNLVIHSDALHYQTDLLSSGGVALSLLLIGLSGFEIIDTIVASIVAFYIIYSAIGLIKNGVYILLDASLKTDLTDAIGKIIKEQENITTFHLLRTRTAADTNFIDVHLVFHATISLLKAHEASEKVEQMIRNLDNSKIWDINIHLDPYNDLNEDKEFLDKKEKK